MLDRCKFSQSVSACGGSARLAAGIDAAEARRDAAFVADKAKVIAAIAEVDDAIVGLTQQRLRSGKLNEAVEGYRQAVASTQVLYREGATGHLELLDAERALYPAESAAIANRLDQLNAYVSLNKALGGGWSGAAER